MRYAVFGDVSGHHEPFRDGLATVGVDLDAATMPTDLTVIQVGDLIHKGPDSTRIVICVQRMLNKYPGRWIQLLGNHEGQYLGGEPFWRQQIDDHIVKALQLWVEDGMAKMAHAINTVNYGPALVTHAGLTRTLWELIGAPEDAQIAAERLNKILDDHPNLAFESGIMLSGGGRNPGVAWTEPTTELWPSWEDAEMPFAQVHGHASGWWWGRKEWSRSAPMSFRRNDSHVDQQLRQLRVQAGGNVIIGIDPGYGQYAPGRPLLPLILEAT